MNVTFKKKRRWYLVLTAILGCLACLGIQRSLFCWLENHRGNFVAPLGLEISLIRLQNIQKLKGDTLMMGSSITERFRSNETTAVLGIPGNSFVSGLELMENVVEFPAGTTYILETNNILNEPNELVLVDARKWDFRVFRGSPHFSVAAKPSNLILSYLEFILRPGADYSSTNCDAVPSLSPEPLVQVNDMTAEEQTEWRRVIDGVRKIRQKGGRICMVRLPVSDASRYQASYEAACKIAKFAQIPVLNYNTPYWRHSLHFPDGTHLDSRARSTSMFRDVIVRDAKNCAR